MVKIIRHPLPWTNPVGVLNHSLDFARIQRLSPKKCVRQILAIKGFCKKNLQGVGEGQGEGQ